MTKKKELAKRALKKPNLFTPAELAYFKLWLNMRKHSKEKKKEQEQSQKPYLS